MGSKVYVRRFRGFARWVRRCATDSIPAGGRLVLASVAALREAVDAMFEFQLGREAPDADKEAIVAFIRTLAGESEEVSP